MKTNLLNFVLAASLAALLPAACSVSVRLPAVGVAVAVPGVVIVSGAPPPAPPYTEVIVASPGPGFVWITGAWVWGGNRWVWEGGRWERPPRPGAVWVPHHYEFRDGRHVYVRGGWK